MKIRVTVTMNLVGCKDSSTVEVDDDDWKEMSEREKDEHMLDEVWSMIDWNHEEISE